MLISSIAVGGITGAVFQLGQAGHIPHWGKAEPVPPIAKLIFVAMAGLGIMAQYATWRGGLNAGLCALGAFQFARYVVQVVPPKR